LQSGRGGRKDGLKMYRAANMDLRRNDTEVIRVLIAESDASTREGLIRAIQDGLDFEVVDTCDTGTQLLAAINEKAPDVLVIDVELAGTSDFKALELLDMDPPPKVIFVADSGQYALQAFDLGATDYLVRPVNEARFMVALDRVRSHIQLNVDTFPHAPIHVLKQTPEGDSQIDSDEAADRDSHYLRRIVVRTSDSIKLVDPADVYWIEACGDNLIIHTKNGKHTIRGTMKGMERKLDPENFVRIHRSAIINLKQLEQLQPYFHGEYVVVLCDGTQLRLSRGRKEPLERLLGQSL
jgi:two-component system LytT family response regulator